jgi:hypothetical protein
MTSPFHPPIRSIEEIVEHNAQRFAAAVARKLQGIPEPKLPPYSGKTPQAHAKYRELEVDIKTDVGYGDTEAFRLMKHHAYEATSTAEAQDRQWEMSTKLGGVGGWNNLPKHAIDMIKGLRSRIDPVLKVAEAEFDATQVLRRKYDEIESTHLEQVKNIQRKYDQMRDGAGKYARSKIRQWERTEIQETLSSRASSVRDWEAEVLDAYRSAGFLMG